MVNNLDAAVSGYPSVQAVKTAINTATTSITDNMSSIIDGIIETKEVLEKDDISNYIDNNNKSFETIASTEAVYNLYLDAMEAAQGRVQCRVFDTAVAAGNWLIATDETEDGSANRTLLNIGDIIYTRNPQDDSFWWDGAQLLVYNKPIVLSDYATINYVDEKVRTKADASVITGLQNQLNQLSTNTAEKEHTHTEYLSVNGTAEKAKQVNGTLTVKIGNTSSTWNGSTNKTLDINPSAIGAVSTSDFATLNTAYTTLQGTVNDLLTRIQALEAKLNAISKFTIATEIPTNAAANEITFVIPQN